MGYTARNRMDIRNGQQFGSGLSSHYYSNPPLKAVPATNTFKTKPSLDNRMYVENTMGNTNPTFDVGSVNTSVIPEGSLQQATGNGLATGTPWYSQAGDYLKSKYDSMFGGDTPKIENTSTNLNKNLTAEQIKILNDGKGRATINPDGTYNYEAPTWMDRNAATVGAVAQGVGAAAGLAQAGLGYKNYRLAKDSFNFEKQLATKNLANQALQYNTELENNANVGMSLAGNTMSQSDRDAYMAGLASKKVSGTL